MATQTVEIKKFHAVGMRDQDGNGKIYHGTAPQTKDEAIASAKVFASWYNFEAVTFELRETYGD